MNARIVDQLLRTMHTHRMSYINSLAVAVADPVIISISHIAAYIDVTDDNDHNHELNDSF